MLPIKKQEGTMVKPHIKYRVTLTEAERQTLRQLVKKGNTAGYRIRHAHILLALDEIPAPMSIGPMNG